MRDNSAPQALRFASPSPESPSRTCACCGFPCRRISQTPRQSSRHSWWTPNDGNVKKTFSVIKSFNSPARQICWSTEWRRLFVPTSSWWPCIRWICVWTTYYHQHFDRSAYHRKHLVLSQSVKCKKWISARFTEVIIVNLPRPLQRHARLCRRLLENATRRD